MKPGEEDAFVAAWREFVTWAAELEGHGTFRLVQDLAIALAALAQAGELELETLPL